VRARLCGMALGVALLAAACGGGESSQEEASTAPTPAAVKRCLEQGGKEMREGAAIGVKSSTSVHSLFAVGPENGHIGVVLTPGIGWVNRISAYFENNDELDTDRVMDPGVVVLTDIPPKPEDLKLGLRCAGG
jgi:hypothetical protein